MADEDYVKVASLDKLPPGEMMRVEIGFHEILLVNLNGKIHACSDIVTVRKRDVPHRPPSFSSTSHTPS